MRDVFFYSISLVVLVVFFNDNSIEWWEALILFLWYFCYVIFMKFNEAVEDKLRSMLGLEAIVSIFYVSKSVYASSQVNTYKSLPG